MCKTAQPASDTSVILLHERVSVCNAAQPASADTSVILLQHERVSVCSFGHFQELVNLVQCARLSVCNAAQPANFHTARAINP